MVSIIGCGDVGRRIAIELINTGTNPASIVALARGSKSAEAAAKIEVGVCQADFDHAVTLPESLQGSDWFYLVPPQKSGLSDERSRRFLGQAEHQAFKPARIVLISTTGVYGDAGGEWVDESTPTQPQTERGKRRLDLEMQWQKWATEHDVPLRILRVPGIYANSRIPIERLKRGTPVVRASECGYSNRIHADDLALIAIAAGQYCGKSRVFNATDGKPGKISEYLQAAAKVVGLPEPSEISMAQAQQVLSAGMLSYLSESRKISNAKMLSELNITLRYPDFRIGLLH